MEGGEERGSRGRGGERGWREGRREGGRERKREGGGRRERGNRLDPFVCDIQFSSR